MYGRRRHIEDDGIEATIPSRHSDCTMSGARLLSTRALRSGSLGLRAAKEKTKNKNNKG